jgi:hypothetical protein
MRDGANNTAVRAVRRTESSRARESLLLLQRAVPALHLRQRRPLDLEFEVSIERVPMVMSAKVNSSPINTVGPPATVPACRNAPRNAPVPHGSPASSACPPACDKIPRTRRPGNPTVAKFATSPSSRRCAHARPHQRTRFFGAMARGEITQNGVGFPHRDLAIPDHRDAAMRIDREEIRGI